MPEDVFELLIMKIKIGQLSSEKDYTEFYKRMEANTSVMIDIDDIFAHNVDSQYSVESYVFKEKSPYEVGQQVHPIVLISFVNDKGKKIKFYMEDVNFYHEVEKSDREGYVVLAETGRFDKVLEQSNAGSRTIVVNLGRTSWNNQKHETYYGKKHGN